jgi:hypothetical protein
MTLKNKDISDAVTTGLKLTEAAVREVWSVLDAASEKKQPSEQLSQTAIQAIQGITPVNKK